ncbi:VOC family protein [Nocardia huaxiensis]|uniref:VOC family protein n=1 Tax=Nocardia huaxiensis TaxID=2755382 RepID=UPI0023E7FC76|nr:VOC family protein [Nocardia huaxiensis]
MPAFTPGAPCWFDVTAPDVPAAAEFYTGLFGWTAEDTGPETNHYTLLLQDGRRVAGLTAATAPDGTAKPALWLPYFSVADAAASTATAVDAGAGVFVGPTEVPGLVFAILTDPDGAPYGITQLIEHPGTEDWGGIGNPCWVEYSAARTPSDAMTHYARVFGWHYTNAAWETATENPYQALSAAPGDREFGGVHRAAPGEPAPFWAMNIHVADVDETVERALSLGGKLLQEAVDLPGPSRLAVLADPAGAGFAVMSVG